MAIRGDGISDSDHTLQVLAILVSAGSAFFTLVTAVFVLIQVRLFRRQLKFEVLLQIKTINRELLLLGFDRPELFDVINGEGQGTEAEKRYLQLWLNQIDLIYHAKCSRLLTPEYISALERDIADFFKIDRARQLWREVRHYYPPGLQHYLDRVVGVVAFDGPTESPTKHD